MLSGMFKQLGELAARGTPVRAWDGLFCHHVPPNSLQVGRLSRHLDCQWRRTMKGVTPQPSCVAFACGHVACCRMIAPVL
jgi:hypothetical protein